jgi:hypothetical protein
MSAIGFGLSAASQVAGFSAQQQQTDAYNAAARQNAINAGVAASNKYADEGRSYVYDSKKNMQEGMKAVFSGRKARGTAIASAGSAGIDGSSISLGDIVSDINNETALNLDNVAAKQDDMKHALVSNLKSYEAEARGRINSMPYKEGPSPFALGLNIASAGLGSVKDSPKGKAWLGIET